MTRTMNVVMEDLPQASADPVGISSRLAMLQTHDQITLRPEGDESSVCVRARLTTTSLASMVSVICAAAVCCFGCQRQDSAPVTVSSTANKPAEVVPAPGQAEVSQVRVELPEGDSTLDGFQELPDLPQRANEVLDPVKQKYIWDSEHVTFEIEKRFGEIFKAALKSRNAEQLVGLFHEEFQGEVIDRPGNPNQTRRRKGLVSEQRLERSGDASKSVDSAGMVDDLLQAMTAFDVIEQVGLRVLKIERLDSLSGERWTTQILLTAFGRDDQGGLLAWDSIQDVQFQYQDESEIDGGRVVSQWKVASQRLRACPRQLMEEVTEQAGLADLPLQDNWSTNGIPQQFQFQMAVEDYDRDGFLDVAIASVTGEPILLRSIQGERFEDVADSFGFEGWSPQDFRYLSTWIDYDNDGYPDLILGSRLYHNVDGKKFDDVTDGSGLRFNQMPMGCTVADYDGDGLLDIYVLYQFSDEHRRKGPIPWVGDDSSGQDNQLWHNEGNGRFRNVTRVSGAAGGRRNSFAAAWLYADGDHLPDLYVANDFGTNVMLRNRGDGAFEDVSQSKAVADYATSMGVAAGDIDNDGLPELYVANMYSKMGRRIIAHVNADDYSAGIHEQIKGACAGNRLYRRDSDEPTYQDLSTDLGVNGIGWAFAPAMVDLDNDGLLDMYSTAGFMSFDRKKPDG